MQRKECWKIKARRGRKVFLEGQQPVKLLHMKGHLYKALSVNTPLKAQALCLDSDGWESGSVWTDLVASNPTSD